MLFRKAGHSGDVQGRTLCVRVLIVHVMYKRAPGILQKLVGSNPLRVHRKW